jgi:hypothetical protein
MAAHLTSQYVILKGFKKCCISSTLGEMICCGMLVKRDMLGVSVRKMKALTVKMETVTVIGKGR